MCYDVSYLTRKAEKYAEHYGKKQDWEKIMSSLPPAYHVSGFDEPQLPAITGEHDGVVALDWPFIPMGFAPRSTDGRPINTLNARDDRIFKSSSVYHQAAKDRRCVVVIDGFFDHHKKEGVAFPYYIRYKGNAPIFVGGLWQEFSTTEIQRNCLTLVTTSANKEMAWIHNEPAYSPESRMIFVLHNRDEIERWIYGTKEEAQEMIRPLPYDVLDFHPCKPIKSNRKLNRRYPGNVPEIREKTYYPELEESQGSLF